jgi:hypothetical protein
MNQTVTLDWQELNQRYLALALHRVRWGLQHSLAQTQGGELEPEPDPAEPDPAEPDPAEPEAELQAIADTLSTPPALETLCAAFCLTPFERDVLLLCAGVELSASLAQLCATAQGGAAFTYPTFSLALAALPEAQWGALAPVRPLRYWRLIEVSQGESLTQSRLRIDERVLHYLNGVAYLDDRLRGLVEPVSVGEALPESHQQLVEQLSALWWRAWDTGATPAIQLYNAAMKTQGTWVGAAISIAAMAGAELGMTLYRMRAIDIPSAVAEREALAILWQREALLSNSALLLDCTDLEGTDWPRRVLPWVERLSCPLVLVAPEPLQRLQQTLVRLEVPEATSDEQYDLWQRALGPVASQLNGQLDQVVAQFHLSPQNIQAVGAEVQVQTAGWSDAEAACDPFDALWDVCRSQSRPRLEDLAQRIQPVATWEHLVVPEFQRQMLQEIAAQVRQRRTVYDLWEFAVRGANGLGISVLFAGASGTGKTMAAEVLAQELRLDLYRIDLSQVVSKYIGETEKNLRRVFDAAEMGGAVLLFDEADALFGKRSEVRDSHDRYANIEVSYLLQRMEAYRGLAILTTNLKTAIDPAFLRRLRFVVQFPFPDLAQRQEIWRRMFPAKLPTEGLDWGKLARLNLTGGNIRNIALNAAFLAADAGESVGMGHLLRATQTEYAKLEKPLTDGEVGGWL